MWVAMRSSNKGIQLGKSTILDVDCRSEGLTAMSDEDPPSIAMTWRKEGKATACQPWPPDIGLCDREPALGAGSDLKVAVT